MNLHVAQLLKDIITFPEPAFLEEFGNYSPRSMYRLTLPELHQKNMVRTIQVGPRREQARPTEEAKQQIREKHACPKSRRVGAGEEWRRNSEFLGSPGSSQLPALRYSYPKSSVMDTERHPPHPLYCPSWLAHRWQTGARPSVLSQLQRATLPFQRPSQSILGHL